MLSTLIVSEDRCFLQYFNGKVDTRESFTCILQGSWCSFLIVTLNYNSATQAQF